MHDLPDTDEADAAAERYWPDFFKWVLKTNLKEKVEKALLEEQAFSSFHQGLYSGSFPTYEAFIGRLAEGVAMGAENGLDDRMDEIHRALVRDLPFPPRGLYAVYFWPDPFDEPLGSLLYREVFEEFRSHPVYRHIHEDHYHSHWTFDEFIDHLAHGAVAGARNGADKTLGDIYRAFIYETPLPAFRRRPRRVR
ncbi:MAG: hypothetical protein AB1585_04205 [Thermodesulfobacteriota bacterium]